jgi:hypothetical protein
MAIQSNPVLGGQSIDSLLPLVSTKTLPSNALLEQLDIVVVPNETLMLSNVEEESVSVTISVTASITVTWTAVVEEPVFN